ncbi:MAG: EF-hand domain-containing protein, partial [Pseudomonadota bacterium]
MTGTLNTDAIEAMWQRFRTIGAAGTEVIGLAALHHVLAELGHDASDEEVRHLTDDVAGREGIGHAQFAALLASLHGDTETRVRIAFDVLDVNGDGRISRDELRHFLGRLSVGDVDLDAVFAEADRDGDGNIDVDEFRALVPHGHTGPSTCYRDHTTPFASTIRRGGASTAEIAASQPAPAPIGDTAHRAQAGHRRSGYGQGTSILQMQIGLFRLLQGAAYRCFRESYSAHAMTHLRARTLPYTMPDFVAFVDRAIALYKAVGVIDPACFPVLDAVTTSVNAEYARLQDRIAYWPNVTKTKAMVEAAAAMERQRTAQSSVAETLMAGVELALTLRRKNLSLGDLGSDAMARHEAARLRHLELHHEMAAPPGTDGADPAAYLAVWNRVLISSSDEAIDGAMMPAAYWYEDFMPKLLAACSVSSADDIAQNTAPDTAALDRWFATARDDGEFDHYGADVAGHFPACNPAQKLAIRQAWRLTRHYMNGVQKRREREEFGRESGFLSQYVAFLDVYLGRSDVRQAQMRVSFPYYIGRPTWRFLHTVAELVAALKPDAQPALVDLFKDFFRVFATVYACPYCRHHLNLYVVRNVEIDMYPLEYLLLGPRLGDKAGTADLLVSIEDKLSVITDGASLRLFLWKLHNTVSASIERTEPWFRRDEHAIYTTRHWPSVGA